MGRETRRLSQVQAAQDGTAAAPTVRAVNGHTATFHCAEIRQDGPVGLTPAQCRRPCGIAKVMYEAELAWRNSLAAVTVADLTENAAGVSADRAARWLGRQARPGLAPAPGPAPDAPATPV